MVKNIEYDDIIKHAIYNIYPIIDEISFYANNVGKLEEDDSLVLDDLYGRVFSKSIYEGGVHPYGISKLMPYYADGTVPGYETNIIDYLRVPYRKIPIYQVSKNDEAKDIINSIQNKNLETNILIRGQEKLYYIERSETEANNLYGEPKVKEPSFFASFSRTGINEDFIRCLWNWQGRELLKDIGNDLLKCCSEKEYQEFTLSRIGIEGTKLISYFSLGMAQHYGLPSIGLDFTDKYENALFFASTHYDSDEKGNLKVTPVNDYENSMIYVFSCPRNIVFNYNAVKPKHFPEGRPDYQNAWFGYVGWGEAKNQMALYLTCCIKITPDMASILPDDYYKKMFPCASDDLVLSDFLNMKNNPNLEKEVKDVLKRVYDVYA